MASSVSFGAAVPAGKLALTARLGLRIAQLGMHQPGFPHAASGDGTSQYVMLSESHFAKRLRHVGAPNIYCQWRCSLGRKQTCSYAARPLISGRCNTHVHSDGPEYLSYIGTVLDLSLKMHTRPVPRSLQYQILSLQYKPSSSRQLPDHIRLADGTSNETSLECSKLKRSFLFYFWVRRSTSSDVNVTRPAESCQIKVDPLRSL